MTDSDILRQIGWPDELIEAALGVDEPLRESDTTDTLQEHRIPESEAPVAPSQKR